METTERSKMNGKPVYFTDNRILNLDSGFAPKLLCDGPTFTAGTACVYDCYARLTFEGHKRYIPGNKLRFLQYVNAKNRAYWEKEVVNGAVLL